MTVSRPDLIRGWIALSPPRPARKPGRPEALIPAGIFGKSQNPAATFASEEIWTLVNARLKKVYYRLLVPALLAMAAATASKAMHVPDPGKWIDPRAMAPLIFTLAVAFAAALPIFFRAAFAHRMQREKRVPETAFFHFQRRLIRTALMTPYLGAIVCLFDLPRFYLAGVFLAILYAVYYHYPSRRRIAFDRRLFRVG